LQSYLPCGAAEQTARNGRVAAKEGIDLGTTNSCVAVMEAAAEGHRERRRRAHDPVHGRLHRRRRAPGRPAGKRQAVTNPDNTLFAIKRLIGRRSTTRRVEKDKAMVPYEIVKGPNGDAWVEKAAARNTPRRISAFILRR
jgi:molecular chaperone DnaK